MRGSSNDTVVAIASPPGRGAISIIRISGREAVSIGLGSTGLEREGCEPRYLNRTQFCDSRGQAIDDVLVAYFPGPKSYTGEDVVEVFCHGSTVITRRIIEECIGAGARPAEPGEFTLRAFVNGKMDLTQAEAIRDLIESQTEFQARIASEQLRGGLSRELGPIRTDLIEVICQMETRLEFVEDDVLPEARETLRVRLGKIFQELLRIEQTFDVGKVLHDGVRVILIGKPNAGKSSLFNALGRFERAIVTEFPGTTRDFLTEILDIRGFPVELIDTAGIREVAGSVERAGVERALDQLEKADLALFVLDGSQPFDGEDERIAAGLGKKRHVLVVNKIDLSRRLAIPEKLEKETHGVVEVSALEKKNLAGLTEAIVRSCVEGGAAEQEGVVVTNVRHKQCLQQTREAVLRAETALDDGLSEEFPLYDLRKALDGLADITGETTTGDLLNQIFATFCIGK